MEKSVAEIIADAIREVLHAERIPMSNMLINFISRHVAKSLAKSCQKP